MLDPLHIRPFVRPCRGSVTVPGSKSITNRALLLAALSKQPVRLLGVLDSEDTQAMVECLRRLGVTIREVRHRMEVQVEPVERFWPNRSAVLPVRDSGTVTRFLTAACCLAEEGSYRLEGSPRMSERPMASLLAALRTLGAEIDASEDRLPLVIHARGLRGGQVDLEAGSSSQFISALLMVSPFLSEPLHIRLASAHWRRGYVTLTSAMMEEFGAPKGAVQISATDINCACGFGYERSHPYGIEPDASTASYFLALPVVTGGELLVRGLHTRGLQVDLGFAAVLQSMGCQIVETAEGLLSRRDRESNSLRAPNASFHAYSDTFLTLAALAPLLSGTTTIRGIAHTRLQESDRIAAAATELRRLGQSVAEKEDSLEIVPAPLQPASVQTYRDHRMAMSFAVLGCHALHGSPEPWLAVQDPACCAKTFPGFFEALENIRQKSHRPDGETVL